MLWMLPSSGGIEPTSWLWEIKVLQEAEAPEARRDLALERVVAQVERPQEREVPKNWGQCSGELPAVQARRHHHHLLCSPVAARDALQAAEVGAVVPGGQCTRAAGAAAGLCFENKQRGLVAGAHDDHHQDGSK